MAWRGEVQEAVCAPRGALGPDPAGPVGGVWALRKETARHLDTPELARPGAPICHEPPRPHGMLREAASGEAWAAGATPPGRPALGGAPASSSDRIPRRSTGSFSGKRAPARSPAPNRRQLLPVPDDPSPHPPGKT